MEKSVIPELMGKTAMIRELHSYGRVKQVGFKDTSGTQHMGIGKSLLAIAEDISKREGYERIAIISGMGVRDYYRKRGYELRGTYMMKNVPQNALFTMLFFTALIIMLAIIVKLYNN